MYIPSPDVMHYLPPMMANVDNVPAAGHPEEIN